MNGALAESKRTPWVSALRGDSELEAEIPSSLSFLALQVWMCGGRMEDIPCSRVGHIYRKYVPYKVPAGVSLARVSTPVIPRCEDVPSPLLSR